MKEILQIGIAYYNTGLDILNISDRVLVSGEGLSLSGYLYDTTGSTGEAGYVLTSKKAAYSGKKLAKGDGTISGSGTATYIPMWSVTTELTDSNIYQNSNGSIGVGTSNPTRELEVSGAGNVYSKITASAYRDAAVLFCLFCQRDYWPRYLDYC